VKIMRPRTILLAAVAAVAFSFGISVEPDVARWSVETGISPQAEARWGVGRRTTRRVARRTTRRVVRRSAIYAATLPAGCATVAINGASYYQCGATYYQPYQGQYVVVYVD
jgi:hypothetical protein